LTPVAKPGLHQYGTVIATIAVSLLKNSFFSFVGHRGCPYYIAQVFHRRTIRNDPTGAIHSQPGASSGKAIKPAHGHCDGKIGEACFELRFSTWL
jgi:hypothetical protein